MSQTSQVKDMSSLLFDSFQTVREREYLNPDLLAEFKEQEYKPLYATKRTEQNKLRKYFCCEACCEQSPGRFFCCSSTAPDKTFVSFGLGVCNYFKFLKHACCFYFFASFLAALACLICMMVASRNGFNLTQDYTVFFFSTTVGAFSSEHYKCEYSLIRSNTASMTLDCPYGRIQTFGSVFTEESLDSLYNCRNQRRKQEKGQTKYLTASDILTTNENCNADNTQCSVVINFDGTQTYSLVSYTYQCQDNFYTIGDLTLKSDYWMIAYAAIDLTLIVSFLFWLCSQTSAEQKEETFFKRTQVALDDFTVRVSGFNRNTAYREFRNLVALMQASAPQERVSQAIVSATFPECEDMLQHYEDQAEVFNQMSDMIDQYFFKGEEPAKVNFEERYKELCDDRGLYQKYRDDLQKLVARYTALSLQQTQINYSSTEPIDLYLVFENVNKKRIIENLLTDDCVGQSIKMEDKQYTIDQEPPSPDMIQWDNRSSWTCFRMLIIWLITCIIILGSYMLFGKVQQRQKALIDQYNYDIDCDVLYTQAELDPVNTALINTDDNYRTCVCSETSLFSLATGGDDYCSEWQRQYAIYIAVPLLISFGIVIYNVIVSFIFKKFSKCQNHKFVLYEQLSFTFKRAFLLIMNMGLIMILLNYNYNSTLSLNEVSFLFIGRYDDFTADWYIYIGSIIILTMVFNIAFPLIQILLAVGLKCIKRCFDRRCFTVPTSRPTKKAYLDLYDDDIFEIGERYAYLMAILVVSFGFSGVIPILTPIVFISIFLLYFSDKFLIFKYFKKPINYNHFLHKVLIRVIYFAIMAHCALAAYFLSEDSIIAPAAFMKESYQKIVSDNGRINNVLTNYVPLAYVLLLAGLVLNVILNHICCNCLEKLFEKCCCKKEDNRSQFVQSMNFWRILSDKQIARLSKVTDLQISEMTLKAHAMQDAIDMMMDMTIRMSSIHNMEEETPQMRILKSTQKRLGELKNDKRPPGEAEGGLLDRTRATLLGVSSYEYLMKSGKLERNQEMVRLEQNIKAYYRSRRLTAPDRARPETRPEPRPETAHTARSVEMKSERQGNVSAEHLSKENDEM